jgi:hypothetical protein
MSHRNVENVENPLVHQGVRMLDDPEKTDQLLTRMRAHLPFEVRLLPELVRHLRSESVAVVPGKRPLVWDVSYAGDEGGIVCHLDPGESEEALVVSLTHLYVPATVPVAREVAAYQKHRIKKLKKLPGA